jgi:hypothetical protein
MARLSGFALVAVVAAVLGGAARSRPAVAQAPPPIEVATTPSTFPDWYFSSEFSAGPGPWQRVLVTNAPPCWSGDVPPWAGTAHAAAQYWYAQLSAVPSQTPYTIAEGDLIPQRGPAGVYGRVTVVSLGGDNPSGYIDVALWGLDPASYGGGPLTVCLQ